jgi:protein TonB
LLLGCGDSDRDGFPIDVVSLDPGAYRTGNLHTPGGDDSPLPPPHEALPPPEPKKEPEPAPQPMVAEAPKNEPPAEEFSLPPAPVLAPPTNSPVASGSLPGASGGARMKTGTPSAGGTVGAQSQVKMIDNTPPPYPPEARARGLEGRTVVLVSISADGFVADVKVHESSGHAILDNAALAYARTRRYIPARENNVPVPATALHPIRFRLSTAQ